MMYGMICEGCHKGINSQLWKEFDWKVKNLYFNTPYVISTYVKELSVVLCWRKCGKIGDHTHIFWDCQKIQEFWKNIKKRNRQDTRGRNTSRSSGVFIGSIAERNLQ